MHYHANNHVGNHKRMYALTSKFLKMSVLLPSISDEANLVLSIISISKQTDNHETNEVQGIRGITVHGFLCF